MAILHVSNRAPDRQRISPESINIIYTCNTKKLINVIFISLSLLRYGTRVACVSDVSKALRAAWHSG